MIDVRALHAHHRGSLSDPLQDLIAAYGTTDLRPYFRQWITPERMAAVILDPTALPGQDANRITGIRLETTATTPWTPVTADWDHITQATLANGLTTWTARYPAVPVVRTALVFDGGWATAPDPGADAVLEEATRFRLPTALGETIEELFPWSESSYLAASHVRQFSGLAGNLRNWLWAHRTYLDTATVDFSVRHQELDDDVERAFGDLVLFPWTASGDVRLDHLLGTDRAAMGWWERYKLGRTTPAGTVLAWRKARFRPDNGVLIVVGGIDSQPAASDMGHYLGTWTESAKPSPDTTVPAPPPPPARAVMALPFDSHLVAVTLACRVPGWSPVDAAGLAVLETTLNRVLWQSLREDGGSYTAGTATIDGVHRRLAILHLSATVRPGEAAATVRLLQDAVEAVAEGVPEPLLAIGRTETAAAWARRSATGEGTFDALVFAADAGLTPADLMAMGTALPRVDAATLSSLVRDCAGHEAITVIGPDPELHLGDVAHVTIDWAARGRALVESLK